MLNKHQQAPKSHLGQVFYGVKLQQYKSVLPISAFGFKFYFTWEKLLFWQHLHLCRCARLLYIKQTMDRVKESSPFQWSQIWRQMWWTVNGENKHPTDLALWDPGGNQLLLCSFRLLSHQVCTKIAFMWKAKASPFFFLSISQTFLTF